MLVICPSRTLTTAVPMEPDVRTREYNHLDVNANQYWPCSQAPIQSFVTYCTASTKKVNEGLGIPVINSWIRLHWLLNTHMHRVLWMPDSTWCFQQHLFLLNWHYALYTSVGNALDTERVPGLLAQTVHAPGWGSISEKYLSFCPFLLVKWNTWLSTRFAYSYTTGWLYWRADSGLYVNAETLNVWHLCSGEGEIDCFPLPLLRLGPLFALLCCSISRWINIVSASKSSVFESLFYYIAICLGWWEWGYIHVNRHSVLCEFSCHIN